MFRKRFIKVNIQLQLYNVQSYMVVDLVTTKHVHLSAYNTIQLAYCLRPRYITYIKSCENITL